MLLKIYDIIVKMYDGQKYYGNITTYIYDTMLKETHWFLDDKREIVSITKATASRVTN